MQTKTDHPYYLAELRCKQAGAQVYATFTPQERRMVQFGMFPASKMQSLDDQLAIEFAATGSVSPVDIGRWTAVGAMDAADAGSDKMVV